MSIMTDDKVSIKSGDSTTANEDYVIVPRTNVLKMPLSSTDSEQPRLNIVGDGDLDDLQKSLGEMLNEDGNSRRVSSMSKTNSNDTTDSHISSTLSNDMEKESDEIENGTIFRCITYLGSAAVNAPKSKPELFRNMTILNEQSSESAIMKVELSIPNSIYGTVILYDAGTNIAMGRYEVQKIMYYDKGPENSEESSCFGFTYLHGNDEESALFQCHVFKCEIPEAVLHVSQCFGKAIQQPLPELRAGGNYYETPKAKYIFRYPLDVSVEIREDDGKKNFTSVYRGRNSNTFKLRSNVPKQIHVSISQNPSKYQNELNIKNCLGMSIYSGWNEKEEANDVEIIEMIAMPNYEDEQNKVFNIAGRWEPNFMDAQKLCLTLAVDLVIPEINEESIRLYIKIKCKILQQSQRVWSLFTRNPAIYRLNLCVKSVPHCNKNYEPIFQLISIDHVESEKGVLNINSAWSGFTNLIGAASTTSLDNSSADDYSDSDEPIVSGSGDVSKECADSELVAWTEILSKWTDTSVWPNKLITLVQQGIPEALRGEVWQRLAMSDRNEELMDTYRILITKECISENIIRNDLNRTFPAHPNFKEKGGVGQDNLFNITKAYAVYDSEVGYYQGFTFIAASLLIHMPEEQAFTILVKIMFDHKLRDLYKDDFDVLRMKEYVLLRLLEEKDRQLLLHFRKMGVQMHMFAYQWFLTLFTAKFPLYLAFSVIDVVLIQGLDTILQVALSLLIKFKDDLLTLDFENILKYLQISLPKKCKRRSVARDIIKRACSIKLKKVKKYEEEYWNMKADQDNVIQYNNELEKLQKIITYMEDEKRSLIDELSQTKETLLIDKQKSEEENIRNSKIIADYKRICQRNEEEKITINSRFISLLNQTSNCENCKHFANKITDNESLKSVDSSNINNNKDETRVTELELELAGTKLALVQAECNNQELTHQLTSIKTELQNLRNQYPMQYPVWLHRTLSSISNNNKK